MNAWRIVKAVHSADAFSGSGAEKYGGRWNQVGRRVVYCSSSQSLAMLETLVHINPAVPMDYVIFPIRFDASLVTSIARKSIPPNWREEPPPVDCQLSGDAWLKAGKHPILRVPSVIVPDEDNFLLNPLHSDFSKITIGKPIPFSFDGRLL
jgi:RES domain-containing protein